MILAYIQNTETSQKLLQSALNLAKSLDKKPAVLCADFVSDQEKQALAEKHASAETLIFRKMPIFSLLPILRRKRNIISVSSGCAV